LKFFNSDQ